ncbi:MULTISPECIES: hypothetical protein [unclassified Kitasatospora]|uniref:hypothetical protein n=1 Tax=unclassified Kitasatospora TaxID=2633591 RepID=UPI0037F4802D
MKPGPAQVGDNNVQENRLFYIFRQQSQVLLLVAVFGGIALVLYLWSSIGRTGEERASPAATVTVTAPGAAAAAASPVAPAQPSAGGQDGGRTGSGQDGSGGSGWKLKYGDKSVSMAEPSMAGLPAGEAQQCAQSYLDFEPVLHASQLKTAQDAEATHDLTVVNACFTLVPTPVVGAEGAGWGSSEGSRPAPEKCYEEAMGNNMSGTVPVARIEPGTGYCLVTADQALVWFKVTGKTGPHQLGLDLTVTLWSR